MLRSVRVGIHQAEPGSGIVPDDLAFYRAADIRILALPEYFWVRREDADHRAAATRFSANLDALRRLSAAEPWLIVGGTMVEPVAPPPGGLPSPSTATSPPWHNTCFVAHGGEVLAHYRKINLMPRERENGAAPGESFILIDALGLRIAPVVCADVLNPDTFDHVARLGADLIVAPVASPYLPADTPEAKDRRDREIFLAGAARAGAAIVKVCGSGRLFGHPLQGRSLVAAPDRILFRTPFDEEDRPRREIVDVPL